jgi:hypothetical protein
MRLAIMQPYIFPYIGYFQLINAVDKFVVYDNIQFTKKGWINRNRILVNSRDEYITLPLKKDSDYLNVGQRKLSDTFKTDQVKLLRRITESYRKAPEFKTVYPLLESIITQEEENLFGFIYHSLQQVCNFLDIKTGFVISSSINIDHSLKAQEKVVAICKEMQATAYINPIGGTGLYSKEIFKENNINLGFIQSDNIVYKQFENEFVPWLSVIDIMMFNNKATIQQFLNKYSLV